MRLIDADKLNADLFDADWMLDNDEHMVEEIVERQPTVEAEPVRHGRWIFNGSLPATCSVCQRICGSYDYDSADRYCSHCGAKMDGVRMEKHTEGGSA